MKRILSLVLAAIMMFSLVSVVNAEEQDVEIAFKVGDSTLLINGKEVTVETPYVVGAGTTLVPVRVITEAFGVKVGWNNDTKEVTLEYPDVNVVLQIGNKNATVNDHTEVLPEAPVLSPNGVTMVPLRFLSETFGAEVGYDNETKAITVTKKAGEENDTISSSTDKARIGDSYWGWSMLTPQGMMMTDRLTDGSETNFEDDEENELYVEVYKLEEDDDFDEDFIAIKDGFAGYTLSKAEKKTDAAGNKTYHFVARSKEEYVIWYGVYTDKLCYDVVAVAQPGSEMISSLTAIVESFKAAFAETDDEKAQTHDLSNVDENGMRSVEIEDLKVSFKIPAELVEDDETSINTISYFKDEKVVQESISLHIYSKSDTVTAKSIAELDKEDMEKYYNKEKTTLSPIVPYTTNELGENAVYMWLTTKDVSTGDFIFYNVYFEKGDYVYNFVIRHKKGDKKMFEDVMASFKAEELDKDEAGIFLYDDASEKKEHEVKAGKWTLTLPGDWEKRVEPADTAALFGHDTFDALLLLNVMKGEYSFKDLQEITELLAKELRTPESKRVTDIEKTEIGRTTYYTFKMYSVDEDSKRASYQTVYVTIIRGDIHMFTLSENELVANAQTQKDAEAIIATLKVN